MQARCTRTAHPRTAHARIAVGVGSAVLVAGLARAVCAQSEPNHATARSQPQPVEHRFTLVDHTGPTDFQDNGAPGSTVGDVYTFSESVDRAGHPVGTAGGTCTLVAVSDAATTQQCVITAALPQGQLAVAGLATYPSTAPPGPVLYAITGGTSAYRRARGHVAVTPVDEGSDRIDVDVITG